jgi:predicted nucleic acid-binding Zn ribbon protein
MRKKNTQSLRDVLNDFVQENKLDNKLAEINLINSWEKLLGKTVAHYTKNIYIRNRILFVETTSAVVRNELMMIREEIRKRLNEEAGKEMIDKIHFS